MKIRFYKLLLSVISLLSVMLFSGSIYAKNQKHDLMAEQGNDANPIWEKLVKAHEENDLSHFKNILAQRTQSSVWDEIDSKFAYYFSVNCKPEFLRAGRDVGIDIIKHRDIEGKQRGIINTVVLRLYKPLLRKSGRKEFAEKNDTYEQTVKCLKILLESGADANGIEENPLYSAFTPFSTAAWAHDLEVMDLLHSYGADVNKPIHGRKNLPLYKARYRDSSWNEKVLRWLLDNGADVYLPDEKGNIFAALGYSDIFVARVLFDYDVDPNEFGFIATAIEKNDLQLFSNILPLITKEFVDYYYYYNAHTQKVTKSSVGPLKTIIRFGRENMLRKYLKLAPNTCLKNMSNSHNSKNSYEYAREKNQLAILRILDSYKPESECSKLK